MASRLLIESLLQKPKEVVLDVGDQKLTLWVRPSRDPERTMATANARKASRSLRKLLSDRKSEEYADLIAEELDAADKNDLRKVWVNGKLIERALKIRNASLEDREYVENPLDTDNESVTPKQMDEYEDKVDAAEAEREMTVMKAITSAQAELDKEADKIADKDLYEAAIPQLIETQCSHAYEVEFVSQLILRCTFEDKKCKKPAFTDIEQVYQLRDEPRAALTQAHMDVMLDPVAVKN
jgi:hypothetical protein